jgi:hypothetical protein
MLREFWHFTYMSDKEGGREQFSRIISGILKMISQGNYVEHYRKAPEYPFRNNR